MRKKADVSWRDVDKRMRRTVQLRRQGLSLRQIGERLAVSYETARRDLARYESENVDQLLSHLNVTYGPPDRDM